MTQRTHLDDFLRGRIIGRLECGRTQLEVSDELGIAQSVISRLWQRFKDDGNVSRRYSTGRPRVTTTNEDRRARTSDTFPVFARHKASGGARFGLHRFPEIECAGKLLQYFETRTKKSLRQGICGPAGADGQGFMSKTKPRGRSPHRTRQQKTCNVWPMSKIMKIFNSRHEATRVVQVKTSNGYLHDGRIRVWRHRGERMLNSCVMHRHTGSAPGIMVWSGIGYHSRTPLVRIAGTLNSQRYISEVMEPVLLPYLLGLPTAILQQDNARPHVARIVQVFFVNLQIELLLWPARSPDLSPIEKMWSMVAEWLTQITSQAATPDKLWKRVEAAWSALLQERTQNLFESMPRRVAAVICNDGGYSGY
ncbi:Transposable element Tcb1 transposase, partial [Stegodyphus mimosarum]